MHAFLKGVPAPAPKPGTSGTSGKKKAKRVPWVEKYRPKSVDDVSHQEEVVAVLKKSIEDMDIPNMLFYGPPGTGKTSTILAAARQLFGPEQFRDRVLELNASDERGIDVVRDKVKKFAQVSASGIRPDGKRCPPFKIVILDEADSMTGPAQAALRRTMEKQSRSTRFCLICNYVSRIIAPITSRCAKFRFQPLAESALLSRLQYICDEESVRCADGTLQALQQVSGGDLRRAITLLHSLHRLCGAEQEITRQQVLETAGVIDTDVVTGFCKSCRTGSFDKAQSFVKDIMLNGHPASQLLDQLHDVVLTADDFTDAQKSSILEAIAITDKRLLDGADEYLQLMAVASVIMNQEVPSH